MTNTIKKLLQINIILVISFFQACNSVNKCDVKIKKQELIYDSLTNNLKVFKVNLYTKLNFYFAYFAVHSLAVNINSSFLVLYCVATNGSNGSSGLGSDIRELIDRTVFAIVSAGLQLFFNISKQIAPDELIFG
jgi:hypothetical protein